MTERLGLIPLRKKVGELEQVYFKVQKELSSTLLSVDPSDYKELKAISAQKRSNALIRRLNRYSIGWANEAVPQAYERGFKVARTKLEIIGAKEDENFNTNEHKFLITDDVDATIKDLVTANESIKVNVNMYLYLARKASQGLMQIQEFDVIDEGIVSEIIEDTIEQGKARGYASKRIHEYYRLKLLDGNFIDKAGRNWSLRVYSKMLARTRLRMAQTDAVKKTCDQYQNDLVQWSSHADSCPICAPHEGQIYSLSGKNANYPLLQAEPPLHPNCEHDLSPTSEVAIQYREQYA